MMHRAIRLLVLSALLFGSVKMARAQRELKDIPSPDPEAERQTLVVADGFEINLFAADPQIVKPIQMNFDAAGRLWVACSELYPHIAPGQEAHDRVIVLEDADGDGRADKSTVFAEGLLIPTGIEPGDGGAYVGNSTELLHLKDTDGDGRADQRRVVLSGFGTEDTHHILHTLRWGYDGQLYFNQSIYIHSHVETPWGVRRLGGSGTWRFRPESMQLEVFTRGLCNPWGHHYDQWGQSFGTDGAGGEGINYLFPGTVMFTTPGAKRIVPGLNPGSPKHCGLEVVSGRHFPDEWQENLITNDFRAHRVCRFILSENGSGYSSQELPELVKTTHVGFRPVDVKMGPDGAIYIADWYNPIIQHGEVDFRDERRDHAHGRIWRITAKGRPTLPRPKLVAASTPELLEQLKSPEAWTRHFAKRVLKERGPEILAPLRAWMASLPQDASQEQPRLEGLWLLGAFDQTDPPALESLLASSDHRIRAAAVRIASHQAGRLPRVWEYLATGVADRHPRVRLESVRALSALPEPRAVELAMRALDHPVDRFLDFALWQTARDLESVWLPALVAGQFDFGGNSTHLVFALDAIDSPAVVAPLMQSLQSGRIAAADQDRALNLLARVGGDAELGQVFQYLTNPAAPADIDRATLLDSLVSATTQRKLRPAGDLTLIVPLLESGDEATRAAAARAAGAWQVESARDSLVALASHPDTSVSLRQAALDGISKLGGFGSIAVLRKLAAAEHPLNLRRQAVIALSSLDIPAATQLAAEVLSCDPQGDPEACVPLYSALLAHKEGPARLARALAERKLSPDVAKIGLRAARVGARENADLVTALQSAGGLSGGPRTLTPDELAEFVRKVQQQGDPHRGQLVYRRQEQACQKCHAIAGHGGRVGPDLVSIGASAQIDYLIESILDPNKAVKENYHSTVLSTTDGLIVTGMIVRETDTEVVLRNGDDLEQSIAKRDIDQRTQGGSLMPAGLADQLTESELLDLARFLSELGKVGPFAVGRENVVRRWQTLEPTPELIKLIARRGIEVVLQPQDALHWLPAYSLVSGALPMSELRPIENRRSAGTVAVVRCQLEVTQPGPVTLSLNSIAGLTLYVGTRTVDLHATQLSLDLTAGLHDLTLVIDLASRSEDLRLELPASSDAVAQAQWVGGK
jgi:putative heme-binding domain-containing protein